VLKCDHKVHEHSHDQLADRKRMDNELYVHALPTVLRASILSDSKYVRDL
jgi:hypothetical protein